MVNVQINNPFQISVSLSKPSQRKRKVTECTVQSSIEGFKAPQRKQDFCVDSHSYVLVRCVHLYGKNNCCGTHSRLSGSCKFCSFKLSLNLSLTNFRAQINFNEIFHDSLKTSKFARICVENQWTVTGGEELLAIFPIPIILIWGDGQNIPCGVSSNCF